MMDWLLSLVPWWAWLIAAAVAIGAVWRLLGWQGALVAAAGFLAALGYGKGRYDAMRDEQVATDLRNMDAMKNRKEIDDDVSEMGSNDLDSAYQRWLRDNDPR
jgi:hypothetical protein